WSALPTRIVRLTNRPASASGLNGRDIIRSGRELLVVLRQLLLQLVYLFLNLREARRPGSRIELVQRFARLVPFLLVNPRGGQSQQPRRLQRPQIRDPFPVGDRLCPAVLLLANLGQERMALRLVWLHLDD